MSKFVGNWKLESSDNFDEYMKALGVGFATRKMGNLAKPSVEITIAGDTWTLRTHSTVKNTEINFKLDQEFTEKTADGREVKTTMSLQDDGNKLVQSQKGEVPSTLTREIQDNDTMKLTLEAKDVVCTRIYKRQA